MNTLMKRKVPAAVALAALAVAGLSAPSNADTQGNLSAWGTTSNSLSTVPDSLAQKTVVGVASAVEHTLAVTDDGRVTSWGATNYDSVPNSVQGQTAAVAAGTAASFALSRAAKVTEWGVNGTLRTDPVLATVNTKDVTALSVRDTHAVALTSDGQVTSWDINASTADSLPSSLTGKTISAVAAGTNHSLALTTAGKVIAWDRSPFDLSGATNVPSSLDNKRVVAVVAGTGYSMALTDDGKVTAWGGLLGINSLPSSLNTKTITAIAGGPDFAMALTTEKTVIAWGNNTVGQASPPSGLSGTTGIAAGTATGYAWVAPTTITLYNGITVSGTARVGQTLTASSSVTSTPTTTMSGQWLRDGTAVSGATATSYTLTNADAGHAMSYRVTATKPGFDNASKTSDPTAVVTGGQITLPTPTLSGSAVVDGTLTASVGAVSPSDAALSYEWKRGSTTIAGETASSYTVRSGDVGSAITVTVTAKKTYYDDRTASVTSGTVSRASFGTVPTATVSGTARVGQTLTATTTGSSPAGTLSGQWLRDGVAISGATGTTYVLVDADAAHSISYRVTASKAGYDDAVTTSDAVGPVDGGRITLPQPTITGTPVVDGTLTGSVSGADPDAVLSYVWTGAGQPVDGPTYQPTAGDAGHTVTLTVTAKRAHYEDNTSSMTTGTVAKATFGTPPGASVSGTAKVGRTLTATTTASSPAGTLSGSWLRDGVAITGATGPTYELTNDDADHAISYRVTASKAGYDDATTTSTPTGTITGGVISAGQASISGDAVVGGTVTGSVAGVDPASATRGWVWSRDGVDIDSGSSHQLVAADLGHRLTATVTVSKPSFDSVTRSATMTTDVGRGSFSSGPSVTVSGAAKVGQTLTATTTQSTPAGTLSGQWLRDGEPVVGATDATYDLTNADAGHTVRYRARSANPGYDDATTTSDPVGPVTGGVITLGDVHITGDASVGGTLTGSLSSVDPAEGTDQTWVWTNDGVDVWTGQSYAPRPSDIGHTLTVTVTVRKPAYDPERASASTTSQVTEGTFTTAPTATVSGTARVGRTLTATVSNSDPVGTLAGQWLRDGAAIEDATGTSYGLTPADRGHEVSYRVTASRPGYDDSTTTSDPVGPVGPGQMATPSVTVTGTAAVGSPLTVAVTGKDPAGAAVSYVWSKDGAPILGAPGATYRPTADDLGAHLTVTVTLKADGYDDQVVTRTTDEIAKGTFGTFPGATVSGTAKVGQVLTATTTASNPVGALTGRWLRDGDPISGATDTTYTLTNDDAGHAVAYEVTARLTGYDDAVTASDPVGPVTGGRLTVPDPVVSGTAVVDGVLQASVDGVQPADATVSYSWTNGSGSDKDSDTYAVKPADVGKRLQLEVTVTKASFDTVTRTVETEAVEKAHFDVGPTAGMAGTFKVGQTLTATVGSPSQTPDVFRYQWLADGREIGGATSRTFVLTPSQVRRAMSVRVTAVRAGYLDSEDTSARSASVASIAAPSLTLSVEPGSVEEGGEVTLSWTSFDTDDALVASGHDGWTGTISEANGTRTVGPLPLGTTTFVLKASNRNGTTTRTVPVTAVRRHVELSTAVTHGLRLRGTRVTVISTGLSPQEAYTITIAGRAVAKGKARGNGSVRRTVRIPAKTAEGNAPVVVKGATPERSGSDVLRVVKKKKLKVTLALARVRKGKKQTVTVRTLAAGERVYVYYRGKRVSPRGAKADSTGTWTGSFKVGKVKGVRYVKVRGQFKVRKATVRFRIR